MLLIQTTDFPKNLLRLRMSLFCTCHSTIQIAFYGQFKRNSFNKFPKTISAAESLKTHMKFLFFINLLLRCFVSRNSFRTLSISKSVPLLKCPNRYKKFTIIVFAEIFSLCGWCVYSPFLFSLILILCGMCIKVIRLDHSVGAISNSLEQ